MAVRSRKVDVRKRCPETAVTGKCRQKVLKKQSGSTPPGGGDDTGCVPSACIPIISELAEKNDLSEDMVAAVMEEMVEDGRLGLDTDGRLAVRKLTE